MPSPRNISDVKKWWPKLPYDKFIVEKKLQLPAYTDAKNYFLDHEEYTHLVVCPDDLEVTPTNLEILLNDVKCSGYRTIAGICNIDESQPDTYAIQPLGTDLTSDHPQVDKGSWYMKNEKPILPDVKILQVGHCGFSCQFIERELLEKVKWRGASNGGNANFDWQFSKDCHELNIPIFVDTTVKLWHRRKEQWAVAKAFKANVSAYKGKSYLMKAL